MASLPPLRVELLADIREFKAKMTEAETSVVELGKAGETTGAKFAALGQKMGSAVLYGVGGAMVLATKYAYDYNKSIEEIGLQSNVSQAELDRLKGKVLEVSTATATSSTQIAEAYKQVEKAGISGAAADTLVTNAAKAARVAHADLNQTIQAGLVVQQLHIKGAGTAAQTMGMFTAAMKGGNVSLDDITATLQGKAAVALQNYGVDLKSTLASMDVFAKAGIKGDSAAQTLTMSLNKLLVPSAKTDKILQSVGLTQDKLASDIRKPGGLATVFTELRDKAEKAGVSAQDLGRFYSQIFGARAGAGATLLLNNIGALQSASQKIGGSNINNAFADWLKNPEGALAKFQTTAKNTLIRLGDYLLPGATTVLGWVNTTLIPNLQGKGSNSGLFQGIGAIILGGLAGAKLGSIGVKIAGAFGAEVSGAWAGPIGAAIGLAIFGFMKDKNAKNAAGRLISGKGAGGRGKAAEDLLGSVWNSFLAFGSDIGSATADIATGKIGNIGHDLTKQVNLPDWMSYHQSNVTKSTTDRRQGQPMYLAPGPLRNTVTVKVK
jgi:TP901 family phage tail tape measure protein